MNFVNFNFKPEFDLHQRMKLVHLENLWKVDWALRVALVSKNSHRGMVLVALYMGIA